MFRPNEFKSYIHRAENDLIEMQVKFQKNINDWLTTDKLLREFSYTNDNVKFGYVPNLNSPKKGQLTMVKEKMDN
jgi:hypothetical protein